MEIFTAQALSQLIQISPSACAVLKALIYFDVFKYPLSAQEAYENSELINLTQNTVETELENLVTLKIIHKQDGFYFISDDTSIIERRKRGNEEANAKMEIAHRYSQIIASFPFVKAVCISGSLSKNYMNAESDIDFFVITEPHRLWLCRCMLVAFKKIFLFNSRKNFCVNYYIDSANLEIPDRNLFTATEIAFIKPTCNFALYQAFMKANEWCKDFYPNKPNHPNILEIHKQRPIKRLLEKVLIGKIGERVDALCFKITLRHWKKKFSHFDENEFDLNLRSRKNVSKHHPQGFQNKVMEAYHQKIKQIEQQFSIKIV